MFSHLYCHVVSYKFFHCCNNLFAYHMGVKKLRFILDMFITFLRFKIF